MARHLPSLSALRAFEATARHLSFTRAGIELSLTQTAISHRIKELEGLLRTQLFTRTQNGIVLTDAGRDYLDAILPALSQIAVATDSVSSVRENRLNVACVIAFGLHRLVPALEDFRRRHPDIVVRLTPTSPADRAQVRDFDVAIWHGTGEWAGMAATRLAPEQVFPVCAPSLLRAGPPLSTPADLKHHHVIRNESPMIEDEWPAWLQHAKHGKAQFGGEIFCGGMFFSMRAALAGLGVGLGRSSLIEQDLAEGRLVEPFGERIESRAAYYVVSRPDRIAEHKVQVFSEWVLETFGA